MLGTMLKRGERLCNASNIGSTLNFSKETTLGSRHYTFADAFLRLQGSLEALH